MDTVTTSAEASPPDYRFAHPRLSDVLNDMYIPRGDLGPGDRVGEFDLPTTAGGRIRSDDLKAGGRPILLVFGSRTCPVTESAADGLKQLHAAHGKQFRFVMVKVREAHPGASIAQPQTPAEKLRHAVDLAVHHDLPFEVAVDDIDGTLHRRLGSRPSSAYIIDASGKIRFRAQWANETEAIGEALAAIAAGRAPPEPAVTRTFQALAQALGYARTVLDAAGKGSRLDTWKVAPPMGLMMAAADLLFFLPPRKRGLPAMVLTLGLMAALGAGVYLAAFGG